MSTCVLADKDSWSSKERKTFNRLVDKGLITEVAVPNPTWRSHEDRNLGIAYAAAIVKLQDKVTAFEADAAERQVLARKVKQIAKDVEEATFKEERVSMRCRFCQETIDLADVSSTGWLHRATGAVYCNNKARP